MIVQDHHRKHVVFPSLTSPEQALVRSQSGPLASVPFTSMPVQRVSRMDSEVFRVLLLRRLRLPLPLSVRSCRCGRQLDVLGHHRAACSTGEALGRRGFAVENVVAQICREGGARVSTNVFVRHLDILPALSTDARRLEVVAEGLSLYGGCQLAIDATLVSPLKGDGTHRRKADRTDGVALQEARKLEKATYPELCQGNGRAQLVVIAGEERDGRRRPKTSCGVWRVRARELRGTGDGVAFSRVRQQRRLLSLCWTREARRVVELKCLLCMRCWQTSGEVCS